MSGACRAERWIVIDAQGYAYALPSTLAPEHWLAPLRPTVYGYPLGPDQVRTDDYGREAGALALEGTLYAQSEAELHRLAAEVRFWVRRAAWLQRRQAGAVTALLEGSDIDLKPSGAASNMATLRCVFVQREQRWQGPQGQEVTG